MFAPVYLDHNATTPVDPAVREAMLPYLSGQYGNASSRHEYGRAARRAIAPSWCLPSARHAWLCHWIRRSHFPQLISAASINCQLPTVSSMQPRAPLTLSLSRVMRTSIPLRM